MRTILFLLIALSTFSSCKKDEVGISKKAPIDVVFDASKYYPFELYTAKVEIYNESSALLNTVQTANVDRTTTLNLGEYGGGTYRLVAYASSNSIVHTKTQSIKLEGTGQVVSIKF